MNIYELPPMGGPTMSSALVAKLIEELRHGEYCECDRLPPELELSTHYGVSRSVIRDVLSILEHEGFIERGRGIGTLIHRDIVNIKNRLDIKFEYYTLVLGIGQTPSSQTLSIYEKPADEALATQLSIDVGSTVIVCEKIILANGVPAIFSIDSLPIEFFKHIDYKSLNWQVPIFTLLEEHCGIIIDTDIANISSTNATPHIRKLLNLNDDEALMFVDEVGYYKLSRPILQSYGYYKNIFNFSMLRKKV